MTTDPAVGIYVDGVYYGRTTGGVVDMLDIGRVEVLRGPQGTLFGKNTIGGALNVVSSPVSNEFGGKTEITAGNYGRVGFRGDLNMPFSETFAGRIAVSVKRSDGYGKRLDFATGEETSELGADDSESARARLRWLIGENVEANLSVDYTRVREPQVPDDMKNIIPEAPLLGLWNGFVGFPSGNPYLPIYLTADDYTSYANGPNKAELDLWGPGLTVEWRLGDYTSVRSLRTAVWMRFSRTTATAAPCGSWAAIASSSTRASSARSCICSARASMAVSSGWQASTTSTSRRRGHPGVRAAGHFPGP